MASESLKRTLADILRDLSQRGDMLTEFCFHLERRGLYVPYHTLMRAVADPTDHLFSSLTEDGALSKVVEILEEIGCHQEANRLKSGKVCMHFDAE